MGIRFEWDPAKAAHNQRKHGISFELAVQVFGDPIQLNTPDPDSRGELRWRTIGMIRSLALLLVVHTWAEDDDSEIIRVISARHATSAERRIYEQAG